MGAVRGELQRVLAERDNSPYPFAPGERVGISVTALFILMALASLCWLIGANPLWALLYHGTLVMVMTPIVVVRQWVEHYNSDDESVDPKYFYVRSNPLELFLLAPMNFNYHGVHHYYPWIPYYRLPSLQAYLRERGIIITERPSYLGLIAGLPWKQS